MEAGYKALTDNPEYAGSGPTAAILSAFEKYPDTPWLVVACDLPLLDKSTLEYLLQNRNSTCIATTFESPHDGLPEPLITIWEPASYEILMAKLAEGYRCPRKVLINNPATILKPPYPAALTNTNTPEDVAIVNAILGRQTTNV
jgi:molybdopterin-guanine dinucleotide biosynthesis protein A